MNSIATPGAVKFDPLSTVNFLKVNTLSKVPKFMQLVEIIKSDIECGIFQIGEQVPSINETSAEFDLAKQTVERAYKLLKEKGILSAVKGKGYYVASTGKLCSTRTLLIMNNFNQEKKQFYQSFKREMPENAGVDLQLFNEDPDQLERFIISNLGHYDYFVILPHLDHVTESLKKAIDMIPKNRLVFVHREFNQQSQCSSITNDAKEDIYNALESLRSDTSKYAKFRLIIPDKSYHDDILEGFANYCLDNNVKFDVHSEMATASVENGQLYIVKEEEDLVELIKQSNKKQLVLGKEVGIICYNDSPIKEILGGGISTITPDYMELGVALTKMILNKEILKTKNGFKVIKRNSL
ncbi:MAG: GntR family transcriptional regulator [Cyclobacteriaceae bacterium]